MTTRHGSSRLLAGATAVALALTVAASAQVSPATAGVTAAAVTVRIDPSYQHPEFEGWGTSLVWMANATGGYPDVIRKRLVDMVFGPTGLNLNIARYNIGGGNAPTVRTNYMKVGATMPGFWKADRAYGPNDKEWWDPANAGHWNWNADANQRWWVDQIKGKVDRWETFSNSPPWFQTVSGYVSGGFDANADQIRSDRVDQFATYLVRVTEELETRHGITVDTIAPLNEPNTNYWRTTLGSDGQPTGGRQEGAHAGPDLQQRAIQALKRRLATASTSAVVSAMDETNPGIFASNWNAYTATSRAAVSQLNVHTYGTGQRTSARDGAKGSAKKLWMSEVEGTYVQGGTTYTSMLPGLGIASHIVNDMRELEPSAWVLWQPIEDAKPQQDGGKNWGSIHVPFTCKPTDTLTTCPIRTNTKYDTIRNFTHYIRPGDRVVKTNDTSTLAAISKTGDAATAVHVNSDTASRTVTLDLSRFGAVASTATVTPVVTSAQGRLVRGSAVQVANRAATLTVPAQSVTTFLIQGVSGVSADAPLIKPGHRYRIRGVHSGKSLAPSSDGASVVIRTDAAVTSQLWNIRKLTSGLTNTERYGLVNAASGRQLAVRNGATVLESSSTTPDAAAQWMVSTTGNGTYTFINVATGRLLDVTSRATADNSKVGTYQPNAGTNQLWTVLDQTS